MELIMDKILIYGPFETLMVSAAGWVYRMPTDTLNRKILKIEFLKLKIEFLKLKIEFLKLKIEFLKLKIEFLKLKIEFLN
jgi:hypothetical protein